MKIRPFQDSDEAVVISLWEQCQLTHPWNDPHKDIAWKLRVQPELFLVEGHRGWVNYLAVSPKLRGRLFAG
jgi:hypothetical protein